MDVLLLLCQQQGQVLSADEIIDNCWANIDVGDNPVHKAINQLRRALGDNASSPTYIETIRKRGYRVIAPISVVEESATPQTTNDWRGGSPFVGLGAFNESQHDVFFGRDRQIETLLTLTEKAIKQGRGLTLILGPSGCGKSSLVHAGLLPRLQHKKNTQGIAAISHISFNFKETSSSQLWLDLATHMIDWQIDEELVFADVSAQILAQQLMASPETLTHRVSSILEAFGEFKHIAAPKLVLVLDHLEVLLDSPEFEPTQRHHFLEMIQTLADSKSILVYAISRNDFYPQIVTFPTLMRDKVKGSHFDLTEPNATDLIKMIQLPALKANLQWETESTSHTRLDDAIANDITVHHDALPLLQYTLSELYERKQNNLLTFAAYRELGGIEGAIGNRADGVLASLGEQTQDTLDHVLSLLIAHSVDGSNTTSRTAYWAELTTPDQQNLVQAMVDSRLFVSDITNGKPSFRLAHEALLRSWPRITKWLEQHQTSLMVKAKLTIQTENWLEQNRDSAYLLQKGKPLDEALELLSRNPVAIDNNVLQLVRKSEQKVKRQSWLKRGVFALLCLLTTLSLATAISTQQAYQYAQQQKGDAENLLGFMVGDFADKLRSVRRMDLLDGISNKALEYFTQQDSQKTPWLFSRTSDMSIKASLQQVLTVQAIAEVDYSRGEIAGAKAGFSHAINLLESLGSKTPDSVEITTSLGINHFWLGQIAYDALDMTTAQHHLTRYLTYAQKLVAVAPDDPNAVLELSYAQNTLGTLSIENRQYADALQFFSDSLDAKQVLFDASPNDTELAVDIADTHSWIAITSHHLGDTERTLAHYSKSLSLLNTLQTGNTPNANIMENELLVLIQQAEFIYHTASDFDLTSYLHRSEYLATALINEDAQNQYWQELAVEVSSQQMKLASKFSGTTEIQHQALLNSMLENDKTLPRALLDIAIVAQRKSDWRSSKVALDKLAIWLEKKRNESADVSLYESEWAILNWGLHMLQNEIQAAEQYCVNKILYEETVWKNSEKPSFRKLSAILDHCAKHKSIPESYFTTI